MRTLTLALAALAVLLAGCGGSSASSTRPASSTPPASVVKTWPAKWCQAQPGMTKAQLEATMGRPTDVEATDESWDAYEWQFNAFFGVDGNVRQLDINTIRLTAAEKASLPCDTTRVAG